MPDFDFHMSSEIKAQIKDRDVQLHELSEGHFASVALIKLPKCYYTKEKMSFNCLSALELVVKERYYRLCYCIDEYFHFIRFPNNSAETQQKSSL